MANADRKDFIGAEVMLEASYGTLTAEFPATAWVATVAEVTAAAKGFLPILDISGLPTRDLVAVETKKTIDDHADLKLLGPEGTQGQITITTPITGWDTTATPVAAPVAPLWLQLAAGACGHLYGEDDAVNRAADEGGAPTTVDSATDADTFVMTAGGVIDGHILGVDSPGATATGAGDFELFRPSNAGTLTIASGNIRLSTAPIATDPVYYSCQAHFASFEEANAPSFAMMIHRADPAASLFISGMRCVSWEMTAVIGEIPTISMVFEYNYFEYKNAATTGHWTNYKGFDDFDGGATQWSQAAADTYNALWPDPEVTKNAYLISDSGSARLSYDIASFKASWTAGYARWNANTATYGCAGIYATMPASASIEFTLLYDEDFRSAAAIGGLGSTTDKPWIYYQGNGPGQTWFVCMPAGQLASDPGSEGESEGNMAQTLTYEARPYNGDTDVVTSGKPANTKFCIGVI